MAEILATNQSDRVHDGSEVELWRRALLIRCFERKLLEMFRLGQVRGTMHTCIGQEWTGIAVADALKPGETVFSNHRGHGHLLALTGDVKGLLAEILGREMGVCRGIGGSQHLHIPGFYSNGILSGMAAVAAGFALAEKLIGSGLLTVLYVGDGALGEGILYEALNLAACWCLPLLIVVENNRIAQSTAQKQTLAGSIEGRARAFDLAFYAGETRCWRELRALLREVSTEVRERSRPCIVEIETFRLEAHSKGDETRPPEEIETAAAADPLNRLARGEPELYTKLRERIDADIEDAVKQVQCGLSTKKGNISQPEFLEPVEWECAPAEEGRVVDLLRQALKKALVKDPRVLLLGQDIEAPYGGAFKVTGDLSREFPGRVRNTPVSEAAQVGIGSGLALNGFQPVVEIMFGDFLTLGFDQLLNHACKFRAMYGDRVRVPLVVRTPMGGRRGYGPTHSQSIEKHFLGIPGLKVIALNARVSPRRLYENLFESLDDPTLVIENKLVYTSTLRTGAPLGFRVDLSCEPFPWVRIAPADCAAHATVFCYGGMLDQVEEALERAFEEHDMIIEVLCPTRLQPLNPLPLLESVTRTGRLVIAEEGSSLAGLGAEVVARLAERGVRLQGVRRVSWNGIVPNSAELEASCLVNSSMIVDALKEVCRES
jgi:2-oxoisovalerate dehydrogenase E1 component